MPTTITHAVIGVACAGLVAKQVRRWRVCLGAVICSTLADADVLAFSLGIDYGHVLGHRGLSHSLFFALVLSLLVVVCLFSRLKIFSKAWWAYVCFFFLVAASHGILDAMTDGGMGIAFFAPFDNARFFLPWTPLPVSPIGLSVSVMRWRLRVLTSEMIFIWLPLIMVLIVRKSGVVSRKIDPRIKTKI